MPEFVIHVDPAVAGGRPMIRGVPCESAADRVAGGEPVDVVAEDYLWSRAEALLACWWMGAHGTYGWRRRWGDWAVDAHLKFGTGRADEIGDPPPDVRPCGTYATYQWHLRQGHPVDEACLEAQRAYQRAYYAARKKKRAERQHELKPCAVCGGERITGSRGWCMACYARWNRAGKPESGPPPAPPAPGVAREEYAFLRGQGVPVEDAAQRVGIALKTATKTWEPARRRGELLRPNAPPAADRIPKDTS